jgi:molybdopterin/thiamine biosynthesis adenylyltransferase
MATSIVSANNDEFPLSHLMPVQVIETVAAPPLPVRHEAEADTFARHQGIPGHNQQALADARILSVGAGGLGSWTALALVRSGARWLTIMDDDVAERSNASRQLYFAADLGHHKSMRLIRNLAGHMVAGGLLCGIVMRFEQAAQEFALPADVLLVGVDNNSTRLFAVREARRRQIPAVFTMLSPDGMRCQCFLQGPNPEDPCLWCALPNLDPDTAAPCAAAVISSCFLAAAFATFFCHRALMGWPAGVEPYNWREDDLLGASPPQVGRVRKRPDCAVCGKAPR